MLRDWWFQSEAPWLAANDTVTYSWLIHPLCLSSINSRSSRGGRGILVLSPIPFKSDLLCREGRQALHLLSCWKDKPEECLKANCVLCTPLPGCLNDKLCLCSLWWSYWVSVYLATVVRQQDRLLWGWRPVRYKKFKSPLMAVVPSQRYDPLGALAVGQLLYGPILFSSNESSVVLESEFICLLGWQCWSVCWSVHQTVFWLHFIVPTGWTIFNWNMLQHRLSVFLACRTYNLGGIFWCHNTLKRDLS